MASLISPSKADTAFDPTFVSKSSVPPCLFYTTLPRTQRQRIMAQHLCVDTTTRLAVYKYTTNWRVNVRFGSIVLQNYFHDPNQQY